MDYSHYSGCLENWRCRYLGTCPHASPVYEIIFLPDWKRRAPIGRGDFAPCSTAWSHGRIADRYPDFSLAERVRKALPQKFESTKSRERQKPPPPATRDGIAVPLGARAGDYFGVPLDWLTESPDADIVSRAEFPPAPWRPRKGHCLGVLLDCQRESLEADVAWWVWDKDCNDWVIAPGRGEVLCPGAWRSGESRYVRGGVPTEEAARRAAQRHLNREIVGQRLYIEHWTKVKQNDALQRIPRRASGDARPAEDVEEHTQRTDLPIVRGVGGTPYRGYTAEERAELNARIQARPSPRTPEQDALIARYMAFAKKIGNRLGRSHPDRIRFSYPCSWHGRPDDEIQEACLALVKALTPSSGNGAAYSPQEGVDFSVPLRRRIDGAVKDSMNRDCAKVLIQVECQPCAGPNCPRCLGTGTVNHWERVEIDKPRQSEGNEDDEKLDASWAFPAQEPSPERLLLAAEKRAIVERAVKRLGATYAEVIRRRYYEDQTQEEVGQEMRTHQSSVSRKEGLALFSLKFVVGTLDRDGRNLGYLPRAKPPRPGGGVFPVRAAQKCRRTITVPVNFPALLDPELDGEIQKRARWLLRLMRSVPIRDLASASAKRDAVFRHRRAPEPLYERVMVETPEAAGHGHSHWRIPHDLVGALWLSPDSEHPGEWRIKAIVTPAGESKPIGIERQGPVGQGGVWPTADWRRANPEAWAKGGPGWAERERAESRGLFIAERVAGLAEDPEEHESLAEENQ